MRVSDERLESIAGSDDYALLADATTIMAIARELVEARAIIQELYDPMSAAIAHAEECRDWEAKEAYERLAQRMRRTETT